MKELFIRNSVFTRSFRVFRRRSLVQCSPAFDAEKKDFPKDAFLMRTGDTAESIGLVLSGSVLIIQEDVWGNRNILSKAGAGSDLCRRLCLRARIAVHERKRRRRNARYRDVSECKARADMSARPPARTTAA